MFSFFDEDKAEEKKNIFSSEEPDSDSTIGNFPIVQNE